MTSPTFWWNDDFDKVYVSPLSFPEQELFSAQHRQQPTKAGHRTVVVGLGLATAPESSKLDPAGFL